MITSWKLVVALTRIP